MNKASITPQTLPETLIWYYILFTYPFYLIGAQYIMASFLATFLGAYLFREWWNQTEDTPSDDRISISFSAWLWLIAVLVVEVTLIVSHLDFNLETSQILKSSFNWYRNWGLLALFPLIGHLKIRPEIIYRAVCILCLQSLFIVFICFIAQILRFPIISYVSPLKVLGGVGLSYNVYLFYVLDEGQPRLQLFAPWFPALGLVGNIYFCLAQQETNKKWRWLGMAGAIAMIFGSVSRLAIICLPLVAILMWLLTNVFKSWLHFLLGLFSGLAGILSSPLIQLLENFVEQFTKARSGSSEVRARLKRMAQEAWWNEARIWGHGRLEEKGPLVVGHMPIGSHHFWYGTLYTHGIVGFIPVVIAFGWSLIDLLIKSQVNQHARVGLSILLILFFFTFAENLDTLAYLCWPGLLMLGIAFKQKSPFFTEDERKTQENLSFRN